MKIRPIQIYYDSEISTIEFTSFKGQYIQKICNHPALRQIDIIRQESLKYNPNLRHFEKLKILINSLKSSTKLKVPSWIFEYKEIQDMFKKYFVKKSFFSTSRIDISQIVPPRRSVAIKGHIRTIFIIVGKVDFDNQTMKLETVLVSFKNIKNPIHIGPLCSDDVYLVDFNKQVLLKNDYESITKIYDILHIPKESVYKNRYGNITFDTVKMLMKTFKDQAYIRIKNLQGRGIVFLDIVELIKDPYNKNLVSKIAEAYNKNHNYFKYNEEFFVFDKKEYERLQDQILSFLLDKETKEVKKIFETALRVPKKTNEALIQALYKKGFRTKLDPPQEVGVSWLYGLYKHNIPGAILGDEMGLGKGLPEDTKILTVEGFKPVKDLKLNEKIYTENFDVCEVQGIYKRGEQKIFTFTFEDGRTLQTDSEHLWKVKIDNKDVTVTDTQTLYNYIKDGKSIEIPLVKNQHFDSGIDNIKELNLAISFNDIRKYISDYSICESDHIMCTIPHKDLSCTISQFIESLYAIGCVATYSEDNENYFIKIQRYRYDTLFNEPITNLPKPKDYLKIIEIKEEKETKKTICIEVDNPTKLYIAENYIVTHNTVQAIGFLALTGVKKIAVISPASMVEVWKSEIRKFYPLLLNYVDVYSYESVAKSKIPLNYKIIVLDEGQKVKNPSSLAATVLRNATADFKLIMTGTPIENNVKDLFSLILIIMPQASNLLSILYHRMSGKNQLKAVKLTRKLIDGMYLGRKKSKNIVPTKFSITNKLITLTEKEMAIYQNIVEIYRTKIKNVDSETLYYNEAIVGLQRLRMCVSNARQLPDDLIPAGIDKNSIIPTKLIKLKNIVDYNRSKNEKTIVFAIFKQTIEMIKLYLGGNILTITGQTPKSQRGLIVDKFQNDPSYDVIIIALQAGATGLTLTSANHVIMYDLWWNPAIESQAFARAYRRGQTKDVFGYRLVAKDTIDERVIKILSNKLNLIDTFKQDNKDTKSIVNQVIDQVFK